MPVERLDLQQSADGVLLRVRVTPRASSTSLNGVSDGKLLVKLNAPPVDGAANKALCRFLARMLGCSRGSVQIKKGERSREKSVLVFGVSEDSIRSALESQP